MSVAEEITRIKNAVTDIKNAIVGKGVAVPSNAKIDELSPYINSISGGGGSCDLIDVAEFPTSGVQDDKVYRSEVEIAEYDIYSVEGGVAISFKSMAESEGLIFNFYEMNSTSEVKNPIVTDIEASTVWTFYIEKPTGVAYLYIYGIGWSTLGFLLSEGTSTSFDKGYTNNPESETVDGIYVYNEGGIYKGIGVPNANNDKKIYSWNGTEWTEQQNIPKVVFGRVYKAFERIVYQSGSGNKITWYAKFHENHIEMITIYSASNRLYRKITKDGNFRIINNGGEIAEATGVGTFNMNGSTISITYDVSKIPDSLEAQVWYTDTFIFANNGLFAKSIPFVPKDAMEEADEDNIGVAFYWAADMFRGGDFDLMDDNSEWDRIVQEQGWNIS